MTSAGSRSATMHPHPVCSAPRVAARGGWASTTITPGGVRLPVNDSRLPREEDKTPFPVLSPQKRNAPARRRGLLLAALLLTGCGGTAVASPTPVPTVTPTPTVAPTIDPQLVAAVTPILSTLDGIEAAHQARDSVGDDLYLRTVSVFWQDGAQHVLDLEIADLDLQLALAEAYNDLGKALLSEDADAVSAAVDRLLELRTSLRELRGF